MAEKKSAVIPWLQPQETEEETPKTSSFGSIFDNISAWGNAAYANTRELGMGRDIKNTFDKLYNRQYSDSDEKAQLIADLDRLQAERDQYRNDFQENQEILNQNDSYLKDFTEIGGTLQGIGTQVRDTAIGAGLGAIGGSVVPVAGTASGAMTGARIGNFVGSIDQAVQDADMNAIDAWEKVLQEGGNPDQAEQAYKDAFWANMPTEAMDIISSMYMGGKLLGGTGKILNRALGGKLAGTLANGVNKVARFDLPAKLGTYVAQKTGNALLGQGVGVGLGMLGNAVEEGVQEPWQDYATERAVDIQRRQYDPTHEGIRDFSVFGDGGLLDYYTTPEGMNTAIKAAKMGAAFGGVGGLMSKSQFTELGTAHSDSIQSAKREADWIDKQGLLKDKGNLERYNNVKETMANIYELSEDEKADLSVEDVARMYHEYYTNLFGQGGNRQEQNAVSQADFLNEITGEETARRGLMGDTATKYIDEFGIRPDNETLVGINDNQQVLSEEQVQETLEQDEEETTGEETENKEGIKAKASKPDFFDDKTSEQVKEEQASSETQNVIQKKKKGIPDKFGNWRKIEENDDFDHDLNNIGAEAKYENTKTGRIAHIKRTKAGYQVTDVTDPKDQGTTRNKNGKKKLLNFLKSSFANQKTKFMSDGTQEQEQVSQALPQEDGVIATKDVTTDENGEQWFNGKKIQSNKAQTIHSMQDLHDYYKTHKDLMSKDLYAEISRQMMRFGIGNANNTEIVLDLTNREAGGFGSETTIRTDPNDENSAVAKAIVRLYAGADLATAAHEMAHLGWMNLSDQDRATFTKWAEKTQGEFIAKILGMDYDQNFRSYLIEALTNRESQTSQDLWAKIKREGAVQQTLGILNGQNYGLAVEERFAWEFSNWYAQGYIKGAKPRNIIERILNKACATLQGALNLLSDTNRYLNGENGYNGGDINNIFTNMSTREIGQQRQTVAPQVELRTEMTQPIQESPYNLGQGVDETFEEGLYNSPQQNLGRNTGTVGAQTYETPQVEERPEQNLSRNTGTTTRIAKTEGITRKPTKYTPSLTREEKAREQAKVAEEQANAIYEKINQPQQETSPVNNYANQEYNDADAEFLNNIINNTTNPQQNPQQQAQQPQQKKNKQNKQVQEEQSTLQPSSEDEYNKSIIENMKADEKAETARIKQIEKAEAQKKKEAEKAEKERLKQVQQEKKEKQKKKDDLKKNAESKIKSANSELNKKNPNLDDINNQITEVEKAIKEFSDEEYTQRMEQGINTPMSSEDKGTINRLQDGLKKLRDKFNDVKEETSNKSVEKVDLTSDNQNATMVENQERQEVADSGKTENTRGTENLQGNVGEVQGRGTVRTGDDSRTGEGRVGQNSVEERSEGNGKDISLLKNSKFKSVYNERNEKKTEVKDWRDLSDSDEAKQVFVDALNASKEADMQHGVYVDGKTVEELKDCKVILHKNKMAGFAITPDGNIVGVFSNPKNPIRGILNDMIFIAHMMGGNRMDCFGSFLLRGYRACGFTPVARTTFAEEYYPADNPANNTIRKEKPDVFFLVKDNDNNTAYLNKMNKGEYKNDQIEIDDIPLIDSEDSYGDALGFQGQVLEGIRKKENKNKSTKEVADSLRPKEEIVTETQETTEQTQEEQTGIKEEPKEQVSTTTEDTETEQTKETPQNEEGVKEEAIHKFAKKWRPENQTPAKVLKSKGYRFNEKQKDSTMEYKTKILGILKGDDVLNKLKKEKEELENKVKEYKSQFEDALTHGKSTEEIHRNEFLYKYLLEYVKDAEKVMSGIQEKSNKSQTETTVQNSQVEQPVATKSEPVETNNSKPLEQKKNITEGKTFYRGITKNNDSAFSGNEGGVVWFSEDKKFAEAYAKDNGGRLTNGSTIIEADLSLSNPFDLGVLGDELTDRELYNRIEKQVMQDKKDGKITSKQASEILKQCQYLNVDDTWTEMGEKKKRHVYSHFKEDNFFAPFKQNGYDSVMGKELGSLTYGVFDKSNYNEKSSNTVNKQTEQVQQTSTETKKETPQFRESAEIDNENEYLNEEQYTYKQLSSKLRGKNIMKEDTAGNIPYAYGKRKIEKTISEYTTKVENTENENTIETATDTAKDEISDAIEYLNMAKEKGNTQASYYMTQIIDKQVDSIDELYDDGELEDLFKDNIDIDIEEEPTVIGLYVDAIRGNNKDAIDKFITKLENNEFENSDKFLKIWRDFRDGELSYEQAKEQTDDILLEEERELEEERLRIEEEEKEKAKRREDFTKNAKNDLELDDEQIEVATNMFYALTRFIKGNVRDGRIKFEKYGNLPTRVPVYYEYDINNSGFGRVKYEAKHIIPENELRYISGLAEINDETVFVGGFTIQRFIEDHYGKEYKKTEEIINTEEEAKSSTNSQSEEEGITQERKNELDEKADLMLASITNDYQIQKSIDEVTMLARFGKENLTDNEIEYLKKKITDDYNQREYYFKVWDMDFKSKEEAIEYIQKDNNLKDDQKERLIEHFSKPKLTEEEREQRLKLGKDEKIMKYVPKKLQDSVDATDIGDGYWIYLKEGWCAYGEAGNHTVHEDTIAELKKAIKEIERDSSETVVDEKKEAKQNRNIEQKLAEMDSESHFSSPISTHSEAKTTTTQTVNEGNIENNTKTQPLTEQQNQTTIDKSDNNYQKAVELVIKNRGMSTTGLRFALENEGIKLGRDKVEQYLVQMENDGIVEHGDEGSLRMLKKNPSTKMQEAGQNAENQTLLTPQVEEELENLFWKLVRKKQFHGMDSRWESGSLDYYKSLSNRRQGKEFNPEFVKEDKAFLDAIKNVNDYIHEKFPQYKNVYRGVDGHWRFEFSDKDAHFINGFEKLSGKTLDTTLDKILKHDNLYKFYSKLKGMPVHLVRNTKMQELMEDTENQYYAMYDPDEKAIYINSDMFESGDELRNSLLHEIQHAIQDIEGFANGTNDNAYNNDYDFSEGEKQAVLTEKRSNMSDKELQQNPRSKTLNPNEKTIIQEQRPVQKVAKSPSTKMQSNGQNNLGYIDKQKDIYSVTFTKSAQQNAENKKKIDFYRKNKSYWRENKDAQTGSITFTRALPYQQHQKTIIYDEINGKKVGKRKKAKWREYYEAFKDHVIKWLFNDKHFLEKAARNVGAIESYMRMMVMKDQGAVAGAAIEDGIVKHNGKNGERTKSLNSIIEAVGEENQTDFLNYCEAYRVLDLEKRNIYQKMTPKKARDEIAKVQRSKNAKLFEEQRKNFVEYNHELLWVLVDGGFITEKQYDNFIKIDPNFIPLAKNMDELEGYVDGFRDSKTMINVAHPMHKIGTSMREVANPFLEMQKRTVEYYVKASRNKAGHIFVHDIAEAIAQNAKGDVVAQNQGMVRKLASRDKNGKPISHDNKQYVFYVWENGEKQYYQVADREIYVALKSFDAEQMGALSKIMNATAGKASRLVRNTATMTPDFGLRNLVRDNMEAFISSEHGFLPLVDSLWGMYQMANDTQWFKEYQRMNGEHLSLNRDGEDVATVEHDIKDNVKFYKTIVPLFKKDLHEFMDKDRSKPARAKSLLKLVALDIVPLQSIYKANKRLNDYLETGTRIGEYRNARMGYKGLKGRLFETSGSTVWTTDMDLSRAKNTEMIAAYKSKDITLNFGQHGVLGKELNRYIPFFNASLQGIYKLGNTLDDMIHAEDARRRQELMFKCALMGAMGMAAALAGQGDDDYDEAPDYEHENFWILPNGIRIPKDQLFGKLIGGTVEKATAQYLKDGDVKKLELVQDILGNFAIDKCVPALVDLGWGTIGNYDSFKKKSVTPEYMADKLGYLQKDLSTSKAGADISETIYKVTDGLFKALGYNSGGVDIGAKKVDFVISKTLSNLGKYATSLWELTGGNEKMTRGAEAEDKGGFAETSKELPYPLNQIVGTFATNRNSFQSISDFYERHRELKKLSSDESIMSKNEKKAWEAYQAAYKKDKQYRDALKAIKLDKSLTGAQKRQKADKIFKQQISMARKLHDWEKKHGLV